MYVEKQKFVLEGEGMSLVVGLFLDLHYFKLL